MPGASRDRFEVEPEFVYAYDKAWGRVPESLRLLVSALVQLGLTALTLSLPIPNGCIAPCTLGQGAQERQDPSGQM